jgi:hypothetical protein
MYYRYIAREASYLTLDPHAGYAVTLAAVCQDCLIEELLLGRETE